MRIEIGQSTEKTIALPLQFANRHGLVTGATGTGKTVTLQRLAEEFSAAGVPVFAADIKGDLSGIAALGSANSKAAERSEQMRREFAPRKCPTVFWDIFGAQGLPIKTSVHAIGSQLLASMLRLNPVQSGTLDIAFRKAKDENEFLLDLEDLRWQLNDILELREETCKRYGNVTSSSIAAIQRNLLALEAQGGVNLFGEPPFDILDLIRTEDGKGVVNLLHADQLMECPALYSTFLLWLLTELFRTLPEAGDLDKPKLVFFFDESHLLFADAPKPLLQKIERLVRLVRSKGVGVYFVTQSPADIPDPVLAQLGNRIQHALRAYTPKDQRMVRAAAQAFRPNPKLDVKSLITELGVGEALVSVMESDGVPSPVERVKIIPPSAQIGPVSDLERETIKAKASVRAKYTRQFEGSAARRQFVDRMRAEVGLPQIQWSDDEWREGDYLNFVPNFQLEPEREVKPRANRADLYKALVGALIAFACFWYVGAFG